ncbi:MAG TPA: immunoglobulin domain-containing protein, partial [Bacillota bacterium]|nr:immunoglobulin domain-containing protein [Bacillota bacterium]
CLTVQTDGRIVIGGDFYTVNGTTRNRVARLNPNGTVDGSFVPTNALSGSVLALAVQSDNKVIIGGNFSGTYFPAWNARLNADGTLDSAFSSYLNGVVYAVAVQPDGKIVIGGAFTTVNGASRYRLARLNADGSLDNAFLNGLTGASGTVRCLQIQTDGKILIGGDFVSVNGTARGYVARLNSNGSLDTGFGPYQNGANGAVYALAVQPDSSVVIGGSFTSYSAYSLSRVARLYPDGTRDTSFMTPGINNSVQALALQADGAILIGGTFTSLGGSAGPVGPPYLGRLYGNLYPPEFISQPSSRATNVGATVTFSALVNNPTPANYQWRKDGNNIFGATGMAYTLYNVQLGDAGNYSVFVSNGAGGTSSSNALLQVGLAPAITQQPASLTVAQGQLAVFTVGASGTPLNYFWKKDGGFIPGATNAMLTFSSVLFTNGGTYACLVSNFLGKVTTANAVLTVLAPPAITVQPVGAVVGVGSNYTLSVTANGSAPLAYQWAKGGTPLGGETNNSFTLSNAQLEASGDYCVVVTNALGSSTSAVARVSVVYYAPTMAVQPVGATLLVGSNFTLSAVASGSGPLTYQWRKNGENLAGANQTSYVVTGAQTNDTGAYTVVAANTAGSVTSAVAQVNVGYAPLILQQPLSFTNHLGESNALSVAVFGSEPLVYQWFKDGTAIPEATNGLHVLPNLQSNQVGYYCVTVTNLFGWTISSNALLSIPGVPLVWQWQGLVAYYRLNGNATDASGNGFDGEVFDAQPGQDRFGATNASYWFSPWTKISASIPGIPVGDSARTLSLWAKCNAINAGTFIPAAWGTAADNACFGIIAQGDPTPSWLLMFYGGGQDADTGVPLDTSWHQLLVTYGSGRGMFYIDGCLRGAVTKPTSTGFSPLSIGAGVDGTSYFPGLVDDVRLYNRVLSSNEVAQLYAFEADLPGITRQPQGRIVRQGEMVSLEVAATGQHQVSYQWCKDGLPMVNATNSTLVLSSIQPEQAGVYTVAISNLFSGTVSAPAAVAVLHSGGAGAPGFAAGRFGFGLSGPAGLSFMVEASTNLQQWLPLSTNVFGAGPFQFADPDSTATPMRFYRTRLEAER